MSRAARRFFVDSLPEAGRPFTLRGDEAHHLLNVVRVRAGEEVVLFDGSGDVAYARLAPASAARQPRRGEAALEILRRETINVEPARNLTLVCALPRSNRMDFLIEKCTELGLKRLVPMVTQRSVVAPLDHQREGRNSAPVERWHRITIEAAKQCGRTRLTEITPALPFSAALLTDETSQTGQDYRITQDGERKNPVNPVAPHGTSSGNEYPVNPVILSKAVPGVARMIASPETGGISLAQFLNSLHPHQPVIAFIGPEGGFTPEEVEQAAHAGCVPVSLGPRILRVETAAIALAAVLLLNEAGAVR